MRVREISLGLLPRPLPVDRPICTETPERQQAIADMKWGKALLDLLLLQLARQSLQEVSVMQGELGRVRFTPFAGLHIHNE